MLTSDQVVATFASTKFREGYDKADVDAFLATVRATLESYERVRGQLSVPVHRISSQDVVNVRFQPTKFRAGYDQDQVDDFLDRISATLQQHEALPSGEQPTSGPAPD